MVTTHTVTLEDRVRAWETEYLWEKAVPSYPARRREHGMRFRHNEHSLRVVDRLARDGRGLNLTEPVRDGIVNHTGPSKPATLEGCVVRIVDRVAYINHDIDDALRAGIISDGDLP